jgi:hypothetical protein
LSLDQTIDDATGKHYMQAASVGSPQLLPAAAAADDDDGRPGS